MTVEEVLIEQQKKNIAEIEHFYNIAKYDSYTYETGTTDKTVTLSGGTPRLLSLENAYNSLLDTNDTEGRIEQSDGTLVLCTLEEWEVVIKGMRAKGRELYEKRVGLLAQIDALTVDNTFEEVYFIHWE